jgi:hypothetical protein
VLALKVTVNAFQAKGVAQVVEYLSSNIKAPIPPKKFEKIKIRGMF